MKAWRKPVVGLAVLSFVAACGPPSAPATDASHPDEVDTSIDPSGSEYSKPCDWDYDCGRESRCIKRPYSTKGVCGPRGGAFDGGIPRNMPHLFTKPECVFDLECKRGFKCLERQCVKKDLTQLPATLSLLVAC